MSPIDDTPSDDVSCPNEPLASLISRIAQGDHEAFTAFYQLTCRRVYGLARRTIIDAEISRETTQDVFLIVWEHARKFNPAKGSPMSWLMVITHRRAVDRVRAEQRGSRREIVWGTKAIQHPFDEVTEGFSDPIETKLVMEGLAQLTSLQRESISLAFYGCLTYPEVAERLGVPVATVKSRIRDGLRQLKNYLGPVLPIR
ncbi:sigma-70 family RNA polymerase sigma factor [Arthrobacter roseus]|uniref:sigma-70 family RNA polymerase sigma factor n=1 Tax=Arthrobacter roseus TaxID=136274 RepID=UPI001962BAF3|nr:sigma-70 family RNA polymerase sigma factor [Arthrobacter roseus]MBM7849385.1 RNA polymerase sigma-70 factor (ECF subfamily) [Arthrobacter roseus]